MSSADIVCCYLLQ